MRTQTDTDGILDLLTCPGFRVKDNQITYVNQAAQAMLLTPGTDVQTLLLTGAEEYAAFSDGCLYLKLNLTTDGVGACVTRLEDTHVFILDEPAQDPVLQALALAARELRSTMSGTIASAELISAQLDSENQAAQEQLARLNRSLHRTLRLIGNMSDAGTPSNPNRKEMREIGSVFAEIFEKAQTLLAGAGVSLHYEGLTEDIYTLIDRELLERAILNMLSNAMKFTPKGGCIQATFVRRGKLLRLSISDQGEGIPENIRGTLFTRYLRQGAIEDSRFGLGLGMVLVRSAAAAHAGTVLVDFPEGCGTRVTMTLAICQDGGSRVRSPLLAPDYAGEWDHTLLELSDCLPYTLYEF